MYVDYTEEQKSLRDELREYFVGLLKETGGLGAMASMEGGEVYRTLVRQMGSDGWLGVGWPKEYGGQGRGWREQLIFYDEVRRSGAPLPFVTLNTIGPAIMEHGSEEHKREYLPRILSGDCHFAVGYSEPEAGTDLASLKTEAVLEGDEWVINGTKMFTSGGNDADYIWLACRTDPEAPKHKGISIIIVDADQPGYQSSLIHTVGGGATCMTYYENVRAPADRVVGGVNNGWLLITAQLNHERIGLSAFGGVCGLHLEQVIEWARTTEGDDGRPVIDQPYARMALAEATVRYEAMKLMNWRMAWAMDQEAINSADASAAKVLGTEAAVEVYRLLLDVVGAAGLVKSGSPGEILHGALENGYRLSQINTFGGGVNEIQREIVSMAGLRMPRVPRKG